MPDISETTIKSCQDQSLDSIEHDPEANEPLTGEEILSWAEFSCWTVVVLIPMLLYVNGPAVSFDQLVVRWALSIVSVTGGIILTARRQVTRRKPDN